MHTDEYSHLHTYTCTAYTYMYVHVYTPSTCTMYSCTSSTSSYAGVEPRPPAMLNPRDRPGSFSSSIITCRVSEGGGRREGGRGK